MDQHAGGISMQALIAKIIAEVRPYTVVPDKGLEHTIVQTMEALESEIPGVLVECGVWKGGASFAMLLAQRYAYGEILKPVWMYDSFEGMGEPAEADGHHANWWKARSRNSSVDPDGQKFCVSPIEEVEAGAAALGLTDHVTLIKGWYHDTLFVARPEQIAVLRVDCDWYEPCKAVYDELGDVTPDQWERTRRQIIGSRVTRRERNRNRVRSVVHRGHRGC